MPERLAGLVKVKALSLYLFLFSVVEIFASFLPDLDFTWADTAFTMVLGAWLHALKGGDTPGEEGSSGVEQR